MTREEILQGAEIMKAYAEGKQLQYQKYIDKEWIDCSNPSFDFTKYKYRIKPDPIYNPTYRPYKDFEELVMDYLHREVLASGQWTEDDVGTPERNYALTKSDHPMAYIPSIWLRNKDNNGLVQIIGFLDGFVHFCNSFGYCDLEHLFKKFTYLDGSPVGKLEE